MEGIWRMRSFGQQTGHCYFPHSYFLHLCNLSGHGFPAHRLYDPGFLDEHQALYHECPQESAALSLIFFTAVKLPVPVTI